MGRPQDLIGFRIGRLGMKCSTVIDHATLYQMGIPDHAEVVRMATTAEVVKMVSDQGVGVWACGRVGATGREAGQ